MRALMKLATLAAALAACNDLPPEPSSGDVQVAVGTTGGDLDLDGYGLTVDGVPAALSLALSDTVLVQDLPPGPYDVELTGVADNCTVTGGTSRAVIIEAADTARVVYPILCSATGVFVTVATTGVDPDSNGYTVSLDAGPDTALGTEIIFTRLAPGNHTLALSDVAANCAVNGDNPQTAAVETGAITLVPFTIACGAATGIISVTAATSGLDLPAGTYSVRMDDGEPQALGPNATLTWGQMAPGEHTVTLSGIPANCGVTGDNPRVVTVTGGGPTRETAQTTFQVTCVTTTGVIVVTAATGGIDLPDSNGYTIQVDGGTPQPLALNGTLTRPEVAGGEHILTVSGVPANCALAGDNPRTVTVTVGGTVRDTARTTFQVSCVATTGAIEVAVITSGVDLDLDGYRLGLIPSWLDLDVNDTTVASGLAAGDYAVTLDSVATNCQVSGANPRTLSVTTGGTTRDTARTTFTVTCAATERIAFARWGGIMVGNADGSSLTAVTDGAEPDWSPDGTRLAFSRVGYCDYYYGCYDGGIFTIQADGTGLARITEDGADSDAAWRPDGTRIAFRRQYVLYLMNPNGSSIARLTPANGLSSAAHPAWSPDGTRIAFTCEIATGNLDICVINADGTDLIRLTSDTARDARPAWKPDGTQIAFSSTRFTGVHELTLMAPDGSGITRVAPGTPALQPAWSADGTRIVFSSFRCDLYSGCAILGLRAVNPDGTGDAQLTTGSDYAPAWRP